MNFEIIGKLVAIKDKENFHAYEERKFDSGWENIRYRFSVVSGTNRFMLEINGGKWADDSKNKIITLSRTAPNEKPSTLEIAWADRLDPSVINKVAGYRIYSCNLVTKTEAEADAELKKKKTHNYLERTEYAQFVKRVIESGKYENALFQIKGNIDLQYSAKDDRFYRTMQVNKIYRVDDDTPLKSEMTLDAYFTKDSLDAENDVFNCYTDHYFAAVKGRRFVEMPLNLYNDGTKSGEKIYNWLKKKLSDFSDGAVVRKIALVCDMINGSEKIDISYDDLEEDTKELIDIGLLDLDEVIKQLGGSMYGERKVETRIKKYAPTSMRGSEPTEWTEEDLHQRPVVAKKEDEDTL